MTIPSPRRVAAISSKYSQRSFVSRHNETALRVHVHIDALAAVQREADAFPSVLRVCVCVRPQFGRECTWESLCSQISPTLLETVTTPTAEATVGDTAGAVGRYTLYMASGKVTRVMCSILRVCVHILRTSRIALSIWCCCAAD